MIAKLKIIEGLSFNLIVEEVNEHDPAGRVLLYVASTYLQVRGSSKMYLLRRSRIPDSAAQLEQDARVGRIDVCRVIDNLKLDIPAA